MSPDGYRRESRHIEGIGAWLDQRRGHVTASRMGALFDAHPYLSRDQLAGELRGHSTKGDTPALRRGRILEPAVAAALNEEHPEWTLVKCNSYFWLPDHRIGATPDYYWDSDGLIECKTVRPDIWDRWHARPPLAYTLQLLTGLMCTGRTRGILAVMVLSPDYPVYEFEVPRHPAAEQRIIEATAAWWREYDQGLIAVPQPAEELEAMLDTGEHLDWSDNQEMRVLLEERRDLKAEISRLTQRLGEHEYRIKNTIGPASTAWLPGYYVTFRRHHRKEYTVGAAEIRTLRIKEIGLE
jgi:predicted phage-related endonuclease